MFKFHFLIESPTFEAKRGKKRIKPRKFTQSFKDICVLKNIDFNNGQYLLWDDIAYEVFMSTLLKALEPRKFEPNSEIINENTSLYELYFVTQGSVLVMQRKSGEDSTEYQILTEVYQGRCIGHEMLFDFKTMFQFKTGNTETRCFSLRKPEWKNILRLQ